MARTGFKLGAMKIRITELRDAKSADYKERLDKLKEYNHSVILNEWESEVAKSCNAILKAQYDGVPPSHYGTLLQRMRTVVPFDDSPAQIKRVENTARSVQNYYDHILKVTEILIDTCGEDHIVSLSELRQMELDGIFLKEIKHGEG